MNSQVSPSSGHRPGDVIDSKYRLEQIAGEGSTGEVWLATNTMLDMPVALKLLRKKGRPRRAGFPTLGEHFDADLLREAQATARMTHPSIVRVLDFGMTHQGDPFIVMERLAGEDLRERLLRDGPCPTIQAVQLILPIVHAMHAAHVKGIVHRDLKPENIYLAVDDSGRALPKIVDFGIANLPWETEGNLIVGTPAYMAPEQASGSHRSDLRADIYSITVVLYELVAGYTPAGYRVADEGSAQSGDEDGVDCLVRDGVVDTGLAAILRRGLMRHPAARFRTMREMGEELARWLLELGVDEDVQGVLLSSNWLCETARSSDAPTHTPIPSFAPSRRAHTPRGSDSPRTTPTPAAKKRRYGLLIAAPLVLMAVAGAVGVAFAAKDGAGWLPSVPTAVEDALQAAPKAPLAPLRAEPDVARTEPTDDDRDAGPPPPATSAVARVGSTSVESYATAQPSNARPSNAQPPSAPPSGARISSAASAPSAHLHRRASDPPVIGAKHPAAHAPDPAPSSTPAASASSGPDAAPSTPPAASTPQMVEPPSPLADGV